MDRFCWKLIAAVLWAGMAPDWATAAAMPADVALIVLAARRELDEPVEKTKERDDSPRWESRPDGSRAMSFGTLEGMREAIKATGGQGFGGSIKVGR